ncbi:MAG: hypothetical protein ACYDBB_02200 [Armatimonadota bacterium]
MKEYLQQGIARACVELGLHDERALTQDECGTALKYALLALVTDKWGSATDVRRSIRGGGVTRARLQADITQLLPALIQISRQGFPAWEAALAHQVILSRIIDLTLDAILSERLSPELLLAVQPKLLPSLPIHALVFSAFPHVTNELYPLIVDAYVDDVNRPGGRSLQVIGIHEEWLIGGALRRAILFDEDTQGLIEADIAGQPSLASAQVLSLNLREEQACHQRIEKRLAGIPLSNPAAGASFLDDKAKTGTVWTQAKIATPSFLTITNDLSQKRLRKLLEDFRPSHAVIKPVDGTEGRGVHLVELSSRKCRDEAEKHIKAVLKHSDRAILAEDRGGLRYAGPDGPVRFTMRVNACWDGEHVWVESGYAQVAVAPGEIASAGRGGRLIALPELWRKLCWPTGLPFLPTATAWEGVVQSVTAGVVALARILGTDMPALVGIDILLDPGEDGNIIPILLEINPRPAGMSHSRLIDCQGPGEEPGVTSHLWSVVRRLQQIHLKTG